mmetsp:Transcript_10355/g.15904  ORF Transcript_10355/g.15904 Transcript_10355/m.15904 type:complete len:292 (+) Transcript_10355:176-1051(+)|eukprot:CAMPEP_0178915946 /NCGR_PEP_ID=MMETSP0786-20121207/12336_1 /TAXON_ID=186022 /ORGANISM="Thalassionema frauenfeldii, Strain CCMP 1798" /LENGTH=291 /DNA_ID=CAMNT_0020589167 /DNA_START=130 /DNA_END=1005 /DNA_ORIENTATION=-
MTSISARVVVAASKAARSVGNMLDNMGASLEVAKYTERLVPSTRFVAVDGVSPKVSETASFVAPSASVIGDVNMGSKSSIWYGATVRGDVNKVTIGENTSIGDRAVVHVAKIQGDFETSIGDNVTVGPCAIIHACKLSDDVIVGPSAQVLDGSVVESGSIIAPGSVVTPGTTVASGELWAGSPAKKVRELTEDEKAYIVATASEQTKLAQMHAFENDKDYEQLAADEEEYKDKLERDPDYFQPKDWVDRDDVEGMGQPGFIFNSTLSHPEEGLELLKKRLKKEEESKKSAM